MPRERGLFRIILEETRAFQFGFEWPNTDAILKQVESERREIKSALELQEAHERVQEEIGHLLHTAI